MIYFEHIVSYVYMLCIIFGKQFDLDFLILLFFFVQCLMLFFGVFLFLKLKMVCLDFVLSVTGSWLRNHQKMSDNERKRNRDRQIDINMYVEWANYLNDGDFIQHRFRGWGINIHTQTIEIQFCMLALNVLVVYIRIEY